MSDGGEVTVRQHDREAVVEAPSLGNDRVEVDLDNDCVGVPAEMCVRFNDPEAGYDADPEAHTDGGIVSDERVRLRGTTLSSAHLPLLMILAPLAALAGAWGMAANTGDGVAGLAALGAGGYVTYLAWKEHFVRRATGREAFPDE